ncbi:Vitamin B12 import system permease protein BtuC [Streptomyces griseus subsp. griseus]
MPRTALRVRRWAAIAVLGGLLAGCGTGEADPAGPAAAPGSGAGARTTTDVRPIEAATRITDAEGVTVSLPKPPERIVCLVALCDDMLVELGMTPTATNSRVLAHPKFLGEEKAAGIPVVPGGFLSPEVEAVLAHRPDLVIGLEDTHGKLAPALKGATTFWPVQPGSWQDSVGYLRNLAALTGRTEQGERAERGFRTRLARAERSASDRTALIVYGSDENFGVATPETDVAAGLFPEDLPLPLEEPGRGGQLQPGGDPRPGRRRPLRGDALLRRTGRQALRQAGAEPALVTHPRREERQGHRGRLRGVGQGARHPFPGRRPRRGDGRTAVRRPPVVPLCLGAVALAGAVCALSLGTPYVPPAALPAALGSERARGARRHRTAAAPHGAGADRRGLPGGRGPPFSSRRPCATRSPCPRCWASPSGAALGVAAPLVLALAVPLGLQPFLALAGAALGGLLTLVAAGFGRSPSAVLLTGAAVAAALQAALLVLMVMADQLDLQLIYRYLLGSLSARTWDDVTGLLPWLAAAVPALVLCVPVLGVLRLGDDDARALGVRVERARVAALGIAVVLIAPVVAVCGPVAWVGFLAPHLARRLRPDGGAAGWLVRSAGCGAIVVLCADQPARLALAPVETPVGAWTALVGVPVGVLLLKRGRRPARVRRPLPPSLPQAPTALAAPVLRKAER